MPPGSRLPPRHRLRRPPVRPGLWLLGLWLLAVEAAGAAPAIAIITGVTDGVPALSARDVASVFRRKLLLTAADEPLVPVNLALHEPLRTVFSRRVFGLTPDAMETYWTERYFHGVSPPYVVESSEAMLRFVEATRGAVGYVWNCEVDARVRVLLELPLKGRAAAAWARRCDPSRAP